MANNKHTTITKGSTVEVTFDEPGFVGAWYVATIINQVEASSPTTKTGYLVQYDTLVKEDDVSESLTEVVDSKFVRPLPPRNIRRNNINDNNISKEGDVVVEEFEVDDVIDAYHRGGWWIGVIRSVVINECEKVNKYVVLFENPREEFVFEKSMLRFHVDWVDFRWIISPNKTLGQELGDKNATHEHDALSSFPKSSKRARIIDVDDSHMERFQSSAGSSFFGPPDQHGNSLSQASAGTIYDYQQHWPFIKVSPIWATIKFYSQKPHFAPLKEIKQDYREGLAIALMVTYENLVKTLSCLTLSDHVDVINNSLETLCHLKTHGFDVSSIQDHLNRLLSLKSKVCEHEDTLREVEEKLLKYNHEKSQMKKEISALKGKMLAVKESLVRLCKK